MIKKTSRAPAKHASLPSKEEIVAFIKENGSAKLGKREIARAFNIHAGDRIWLKQMLKELEYQGIVDRRHKKLNAKGRLTSTVIAEITGRDKDGELIAQPVEWTEEQGTPPKIIVTLPRKPRPGLRMPGIGDQVVLRVEPLREEGANVYGGRLVKTIGKNKAQTLGIIREHPDGTLRFVPVDKKARGGELTVKVEEGSESAKDGDLVSITLSKTGRFGAQQAKIKEKHGTIKSERAISLIALHSHDIPYVFPDQVLAEADEATQVTMAGREDWRKMPIITIDPPDAKDHDDAVYAEADPSPDNPGGYIVTVAIADVAAYVKPGTALDREALKRGNSVYFPDRVVPMLPERISNDLCSLRPNEARPALAVRMILGADGKKRSHSFHRVMISSAAKLSYVQAQAAIDGKPDDITGPLLDNVLKPLWAAYGAACKARDQRSPLNLDLPERKLILKPDGTIDRVFVPERLDAHKLIEEFMILANVCAAESLEKERYDVIYRVHDEPSIEKLRALSDVLGSIGLKMPRQGGIRPSMFNGILSALANSEHRLFINEVVLRSQAQAEYSVDNYGHFGLNLRRYAHFTSPIRRYADLTVHRALISALKLGKDGVPASQTREQLAEVAASISVSERRAMTAERETIDRLIAHFLSDKIGATFRGQVSGVTKSGLFVKLDDTGADGFIPAATVGADYYRYDEKQHALIGDRTGETYRLGDAVEVKLVEAAPIAGALRFELLSDGKFNGKIKGRRLKVKDNKKNKKAHKPPKSKRRKQ
ncbi:ribonuclease R [Microvirga sp. W0021]|uniref:Ribonuclease R n=1 Tax=Hohaiivirga grylli TaxID=3133970 RepID=A0ABV0BJI2_9HYPH